MRMGSTKLAAFLSLVMLLAPHAVPAAEEAGWIATWTASPQPVWNNADSAPVRVPPSLGNQTIRQIANVSLGGKRVRIVLTNEYGKEPLLIGEAHVALSSAGARIAPGSDRRLTFGGRISALVPPGAPILSDPVDLAVAPFDNLAISLYLPQSTPLSTFHWDGLQTAYIAAGNRVGADDIRTTYTTRTRVFLSGILVEAAPDARAVVAFGDSITDGNATTPDANRRWPDFLARRLAPQRVAVLNAGISGARVLKDRMGVNALARFERDVLAQPGVKAVILLIGINDIGWPGTSMAPNDPPLATEDLIAGYRQMIARARLHQLRILGATLMPFEGTPKPGYYTREKERVRQAVNQWIRSSGEFDAVIDFDAMTRDPGHPARLLPAYDSGDHLHPNDAGNKAMADGVDLGALLP